MKNDKRFTMTINYQRQKANSNQPPLMAKGKIAQEETTTTTTTTITFWNGELSSMKVLGNLVQTSNVVPLT